MIFTDNGSAALLLVRDFRPDMVITDVDVPGLDGFGLCKAPAKPFAFSVLAAKINAVLRRYSANSGPRSGKIREQGLELDPAVRTVKVGGKPAALTRKEFDLLTLLLEKKGRVLGVPYLLETVWGYDMAAYDNPHTVETHESLRRLGRQRDLSKT